MVPHLSEACVFLVVGTPYAPFNEASKSTAPPRHVRARRL